MQCSPPKTTGILKAVACRKLPNSTIIQANLTFYTQNTDSPVPAYTPLTFFINKIRNPPSTQPATIQSVTINQQGKDAVTWYAGEEITITNTEAA